MPIAVDTLREIWSVCMLYDMFDCKIRPKKLNWVTLSIGLPLISKFGYLTSLLLV